MKPRFRRWPALVLATLLAGPATGLAQGPAPSPAPTPAALLQQTRVLYPLEVDGWRAMSEERFDDARFGVAVRYRNGERWLDLFVYPAGPAAAAQLHRIAEAERTNILEAAAQSGRRTEPGPLQAIVLPGAQGLDQVEAWEMALAYPEQEVGSAMLMFARNLYLVKARASGPARLARELPQQVRDFMASVSTQLAITSTGACWLPARIRLVDALPDPEGPDVLASYREPGEPPLAVVTAEGLLVAPAGQARAAELAAMLTAQLFPGCVAPEAIEPQVPAHMREIRIEYRPAAEETRRRKAPRGSRSRARTRTG